MTESSSARERPVNMWEELNKPRPRQDSVEQAPEPEDDRSGPPLVSIVAGGMAVLAVVVAGFIMIGGGSSGDEPGPGAPADTELALIDDEVAVGPDASTDDVDSDAATGDSTDASPTDDVESSEEASDVDEYSPAVPAGADDDYVVLSRGKLYLRGEMPSQLFVAGVVAALEQLMGEGNVISEYTVNPESDFVMGEPADVYIEDTVLFAFASAEIAPDFYPLLGLGVTLMNMQDGVTLEVYGHTDSSGSDRTNLALSQARVDAVKGFFLAQGIEADRITAIGRGENEPVADNATAAGRQLNRRVEIVINGFVFSL
jgi:outer membrane protein OmpA-like peptidoglycan-associated protein